MNVWNEPPSLHDMACVVKYENPCNEVMPRQGAAWIVGLQGVRRDN